MEKPQQSDGGGGECDGAGFRNQIQRNVRLVQPGAILNAHVGDVGQLDVGWHFEQFELDAVLDERAVEKAAIILASVIRGGGQSISNARRWISPPIVRESGTGEKVVRPEEVETNCA